MRKLLSTLFCLFFALTVVGAPTNLPAPYRISVNTDTNGALMAPTNFFVTNLMAGTNLVIEWSNNYVRISAASVAAGTFGLTNATDVSDDFAGIADGDLLTWNNAAGVWTNAQPAASVAKSVMTNGAIISAAMTNLNLIAGSNTFLMATNASGDVSIKINSIGSATGTGSSVTTNGALVVALTTNLNFLGGTNIHLLTTNTSGNVSIGLNVDSYAITNGLFQSGTNWVTNWIAQLNPFSVGSDAWLIYAGAGECYEMISIRRGTNDVITNAVVRWCDGTYGEFICTSNNLTYAAVDSYTISYTNNGKVISQSAVLRDGDGNVTNKPAITIIGGSGSGLIGSFGGTGLIDVMSNSMMISTSATNINFISGSNVVIQATNVTGQVNIKINASGTGGTGNSVSVMTNGAVVVAAATNINFITGTNMFLLTTNTSGDVAVELNLDPYSLTNGFVSGSVTDAPNALAMSVSNIAFIATNEFILKTNGNAYGVLTITNNGSTGPLLQLNGILTTQTNAFATVNSNGWLGIGTNPAISLEVKSPATNNEFAMRVFTSEGLGLSVDGDGDVVALADVTSKGGAGNYSYLTSQQVGAVGATPKFELFDSTASSDDWYWAADANRCHIYNGTQSTTNLHLTNGAVGIFTNSPAARLHVVGNGGTNDLLRMDGSGGSLLVTSNGNVWGDGNRLVYISAQPSLWNNWILGTNGTATNVSNVGIVSHQSGSVYSRMTPFYVMVTTTSPYYELNPVSGDGYRMHADSSMFYVKNFGRTLTNIFLTTNLWGGGSVGIGTNGGGAPGLRATLHVASASTNNLAQFDGPGGSLLITSNGSPVVTKGLWDDVRIPLSSTRVGSAAPSAKNFAGTCRAYAFDKNTDNSIEFEAQLPHGVLTNEFHLHLHWGVTNQANNVSNVVWGLEYTFANPGVAFSSTTTTIYTTNFPGTNWNHCIAEFPAWGGQKESAVFIGRLFRDADNASDDHDDDAYALSLDIHYQRKSFGSIGEYGDY